MIALTDSQTMGFFARVCRISNTPSVVKALALLSGSKLQHNVAEDLIGRSFLVRLSYSFKLLLAMSMTKKMELTLLNNEGGIFRRYVRRLTDQIFYSKEFSRKQYPI